jgi:hypothetical protein
MMELSAPVRMLKNVTRSRQRQVYDMSTASGTTMGASAPVQTVQAELELGAPAVVELTAPEQKGDQQ